MPSGRGGATCAWYNESTDIHLGRRLIRVWFYDGVRRTAPGANGELRCHGTERHRTGRHAAPGERNTTGGGGCIGIPAHRRGGIDRRIGDLGGDRLPEIEGHWTEQGTPACCHH